MPLESPREEDAERQRIAQRQAARAMLVALRRVEGLMETWVYLPPDAREKIAAAIAAAEAAGIREES